MTRQSEENLLIPVSACTLARPRRMGMPQPPDSDVSGLLTAWAGGDMDARDRLVPLVYQELRRRAAAYLRGERPGHTLQPTALVHEAFLRLFRQDRAAWKNRSQFLGV